MPARRRTARVAVATGGAALALALGACGDDAAPPNNPDLEPGTPDIRGEDDLKDPYTGDYDSEFAEDLEAYNGQEVTLDAQVGEVVTQRVFTIESPPGAGDAEPALVVAEQDVTDLAPGIAVVVAATPEDDFELSALEQELGVDLPEEDLEEWDGEVYLAASVVETSPGDDG
ncbi:hypothetical protein ACI8AC_24545 [Geodermatophilus sp. SYSU D00758]